MTGPKPGRAVAVSVGVDGPGALWALRDFRSCGGGAGEIDTFSCTRLLPDGGGVRVSCFAIIVCSAEGAELGGSSKSESFLHWSDADVDAPREIVLEGGRAPGVFGSEKETRMVSADTCVLPGGVRDSICPVAARPGDKPELEGSTDREELLQANVDVNVGAGAACDLLGELDCGAGSPCVLLGSENATRMPSPDVERRRCMGVEGLIDSCCVRALA